jgi:1-acyl-sn-glycerol-3-phosphate acyltransferase
VRVRKLVGQKSLAFRIAPVLVKPVLFATTRHDWQDADKIPAEGGVIVVTNHVTKIDPLTVAHVLYDYGRMPRYLAKDALFDVPGLGGFMRHLGQIPVARMTAGAVGAFDAAVAAVNAGECVMIYPEGTITRDPDLWPMRGKSGAARIALATGVPVIPIGHWGEQEILRPYARRPAVFPRKTVRFKVGDPVPLEDLRGQPVSAAVVQQATDRIMAAITVQVEDLRGEKAPTERFDPRKAGVDEIGNPNKAKRKTEDEA